MLFTFLASSLAPFKQTSFINGLRDVGGSFKVHVNINSGGGQGVVILVVTVVRKLEGDAEEVALAPAYCYDPRVLGAGDGGEGNDSGVEGVDSEVVLGRVNIP